MTIGGKRNTLRIFTLKFTQAGKMHQTANRTAVYGGSVLAVRRFKRKHIFLTVFPRRTSFRMGDFCINVPRYVCRYTWNLNDPCFGWKRPCFGGLTFKNRGHLGSRYIYLQK